MAVERYGSKTDVVVKLVLVFFISLLSFSIGTFVGKKFSDNQHKISQLEPGAAEKEEPKSEDRGLASVAAVAGDTKSDAISEEEISKLAEEFVTDDVKPNREISSEKEESHEDKAKSEQETPVVKKEAKKEDMKVEIKAKHDEKSAEHKPDKVASIANTVAEGKPASEGEKHTEKHSEKTAEKKSGPSTALPKDVAASASGKFTVQVASYPKEDEAQGMAADLKNKGFSAFYVPAQVKGQTWYRVSVGLFTTQKEAQAYREDLLSRAKVTSAIVQKISQ